MATLSEKLVTGRQKVCLGVRGRLNRDGGSVHFGRIEGQYVRRDRAFPQDRNCAALRVSSDSRIADSTGG